MCVSILDRRSVSSVLAAGHSTLVGRQFLPMLSSLPGFRIGMFIGLFLEVKGAHTVWSDC